MIAPDMATMLVYIFTDVGINQSLLQEMVTDLNEETFNSITVDGDTSTSDSLMVVATGKSDCEIKEQNHKLFDRKIVKDDKEQIKKTLNDWLKVDNLDVIITTGGTGLTGRDITPEAIKEIADKEISGFGELFRYLSYKTVGTSTIQSRACAVLANGKYVFALPGSSGGVTDAWDGILKHQLDINHKPCNFVELFPRLKEK